MLSTASNCLALIDCNNFYASCERLFAPHLKHKAIVVLSNNDGCVIARSEEAKIMGVPMGIPFFKIKELIQEKKLLAFSSNYALYGDLSKRVMQTLARFSPEMEIYSIDEAFLSLKGIRDPFLYCHHIRNTVQQETGIPVGVGIGPTKVLSKMANKLSKKMGGVCSLHSPLERKAIFEKFPVENIWGIGHRSAQKLHLHGIKTAQEFLNADELLIEKLMTITGKRIQMEMKGVPCLDLELESEDRKQIMCSRGFGTPVCTRDELSEAISTYLSRASEKLRSSQLQCGFIQIFIQSNQNKDNPFYKSVGRVLSTPSQELSTLNEIALKLLSSIFETGQIYSKAGVILTDLSSLSEKQLSLFESPSINEEKKISGLMDQINQRFGRDTVKIASCGTNINWALRSQFKSPAFTTRWKEIPTVKL